MIRTLIIALTLAATSTVTHAQVIAIRNATIEVQPGKTIRHGTLIIRGGKIAYVGTVARVPAGARVIDGTNKIVTAGFVDASSRVGLVEVSQVGRTQDGTFGKGVNAAYRTEDGYNSTSTYIPIARTGGITSVVSAPRGGLVSGTSAWFAMRDRAFGKAAVVKAPAAMYAALGDAARSSAAGSRGRGFEKLRELLDDAASYARRRRNFERNQTRKFAASRLDLEALQPVLAGRLPLVVRANRSSDILAALRLARTLKLRLIIEGGTEAWLVAKQLAAAKVPVICNPIHNLPWSFERIHVVNDLPARLATAGVRVAISTLGDAANARNLRQLAGIAVARGMTKAQALAAVTTAPADIFGVRNRGRLRAGDAADVVVWSGDPFELSSKVDAIIVGGTPQTTRTRQTRLFERYRKLP